MDDEEPIDENIARLALTTLQMLVQAPKAERDLFFEIIEGLKDSSREEIEQALNDVDTSVKDQQAGIAFNTEFIADMVFVRDYARDRGVERVAKGIDETLTEIGSARHEK